MRYLELLAKIKGNIFTILDVSKFFPTEDVQSVRIQLSRFIKKNLIRQIKRGLYCFDPNEIDELELSQRLYQPSYISLETALNYYGIIPDVSQTVTSVALTTTKTIQSDFGVFSYVKIKPILYFGFMKVKSANSNGFYSIACKEKALLDYFYVRKIRTTGDLRLNVSNINMVIYKKYAKNFPKWVRKICIDPESHVTTLQCKQVQDDNFKGN